MSDLFPPSFFRALARLGRGSALRGVGQSRLPRPGRGVPGYERRPYAPGDEPRCLDVRASARSGHPLVRLREEERGGELSILLDRSASLAPESHRRDWDQRRLALVLGWRQLEAGGRVRVFPGQGPPFPCSSYARRATLQRFLEALPAPRGAAAPPAGPPASARVLLTDPWSPLPERFPGGSTVVTLVLPEEDRPPRGPLSLRAVETGEELEVDLDPGSHALRWDALLEGRQRAILQAGARALLLRCPRMDSPAETILRGAVEVGLV